MKKEIKKSIALLALFFVPLVVCGQKNIPLVLENESVRQSGPRVPHFVSGVSTIPTPTAILDDAILTFTLPEATTFGILIQSLPSTNTVYSGARTFSSSAEHSIDISEACSAPGNYLIRLYAFDAWWRGEFDVEKEKTPVPNDGKGKDYIILVNDNSETADYDDLRALLYLTTNDLYIGFNGQGYMQVSIKGKNNQKTFFDKKFNGAGSHRIQLEYLRMPNGEYTLNVFWKDCWWRGDFVFKSHWPEGEYVFVDSAYYRLYGRYAATIDPGYLDKPATLRRGWDWCKPTYRDYPDHLVIPEELIYEGKSYEVVAIEKRSFWYCYYLLSVKLPNTITHIDGAAFKDCPNLRRINIPSSVTSLGDCVFSGCERLSDIVIPEGITVIEHSTFENCTSLSAITLPSGLTSIGAWAFACCTSLPYIYIPDNVTKIGEHAFQACRCLMDMHLPDSLKVIGQCAFRGCELLKSVVIPAGVTYISDEAFMGIPDAAHIYCYAKEPFAVSESAFNLNCTLHVPYGCKQKYEKAATWQEFAHIVEMDEEHDGPEVNSGETGVSPAVWSEDAESPAFDLSGKPVDASYKGILIRNGKKILVK